MPFTGQCLCGAISYELSEPPVWAHACHCSRCRKTTGTAFAANLFFPIDALRYTRGEELVQRFKVPEAERFTTWFCSKCGSTLPFRNPARGLAGVPMGSLSDDPGFGLRAHIWCESKAPWFEIEGELPQHAEALPAGERPRR